MSFGRKDPPLDRSKPPQSDLPTAEEDQRPEVMYTRYVTLVLMHDGQDSCMSLELLTNNM